jgi:adenine-specific DNA-methyltransferase
MEEQKEFKLDLNSAPIDSVEQYKFEPIKGYPMLHWKGKRPFRSTQYYPAQLKEKHGKEVDGWINELYWGDNLQVMSHLLKKYRGQIKLIYIDPPYDSKAEYKKKIKVKSKAIESDQTSFEEKQYADIWTNDQYLQFMYERLILMRELLSDDGVIFLHCDWHKSHHLRCILDEIFGPTAFKNEIIWHYYNKMQGNINRFASNHDTIFLYSKTNTFTFNKIREQREKPITQIKRVWDKTTQSLVNAKDENGNIIYITSTHKTVDDVWRLSMLQPADKKEPVGYPTQKPEALLERIILACSNPGDLVFDCFMGSGTTQAVAMKLGRRFIGADINLGAIQTTTKRLLKVSKELELNAGSLEDETDEIIDDDDSGEEIKGEKIKKFYTGFAVYNVNHYDVFRNPVEARQLLIEALEIQPLEKGGLFDGEKDGRLVKIMPINRIATKADLNELITGFDYKTFEKRKEERPNQPVEKLLLVCMGHEPDLAASLQNEVDYKLDIEVVDILRHNSKLEFKRDSEAKVIIKDKKLIIEQFYPMNLLQKLSMLQENVEDWRELVESIMIDWNYDGVVFEPSIVDVPDNKDLVAGIYEIPEDAGTIRVKITDLLSESLEVNVQNG